MFNTSMIASRHMGLGAAALLTIALLSAVAVAGDTAYAPPTHQSIDFNGVDLGAGNFTKSLTGLTIGGPGDGLAWGLTGSRYGTPYTGAIQYWPTNPNGATTPVPDTMRIKLGGSSDSFYGTCTPTCTADQNTANRGSTLAKSGGNWVYTTSDGTIYQFDAINTPDANQNTTIQFVGKLLSVTRPNGVIITITYSTAGCSVSTCYAFQTIVSNTGFALKFADDGHVYAVNRLAHTCDPAINCDAYDNYITSSGGYTDALGNIFEESNSGVTYAAAGYSEHTTHYKAPNSAGRDAVYDSYGRIKTFTNADGTWAYSYTDTTVSQYQSTVQRTVTLKDPSGNLVLSARVSKPEHVILWTLDGLSRQTTYDYNIDQTNAFTTLYKMTLPEGNYVTYGYDYRGNVTSVTNAPKSGSGLSATTIYAGYDTTCSNPKTCNQPNWTRDAKGNQTDYTYDGTHGGVLTVTLPADNNGLRRRTYNTYTPFDTGNGNIYRLTRTETCGLNAGQLTLSACPATTDTSVTVTSYGTSATAPKTYKSFQPYQVTQTDGASSLSVTTTYTYDNLGNVTVIDGPRTDVDDRSYKTYDANRRVIFEIGVLPGGNGSPKRTVTRHWYNGDGQETKTEIGYASTNATDGSDFFVTAFTRMTYDTAGRLIKTEQVQP